MLKVLFLMLFLTHATVSDYVAASMMMLGCHAKLIILDACSCKKSPNILYVLKRLHVLKRLYVLKRLLYMFQHL